MSKVLIAGIGTGRRYREQGQDTQLREYDSANYIIDNKEYQTDFVAQALIKHYRPDQVILTGTSRSMWEKVYEIFAEDEWCEDYYWNLVEKIEGSTYNDYRLQNADLKKIDQALERFLGHPGSRCLLIKYGLNDDELRHNMAVFQSIAESLQSGDEIYLDITHSFRSLALFQYSMMSFIENLSKKQVEVKGVFYGMIDVYKEMDNKAPVIDLQYVYRLNNWIKAIHELESYGNGYLVADLLEPENRDIANKIRMFSDLMNLNYIGGIKNIEESLRKLDFSDIREPGKTIAGYLEDFLKRFAGVKQDSAFQLEMAQWYFDNKRYGFGYIVLAEAIITRICEVLELDTTYKRQDREKAKYCFFGNRDSKIVRELKQNYDTISAIRNNVAHALTDRDERNFVADIQNYQRRCDKVAQVFKRLRKQDFSL
jgi:CRISPR-associated Csx2 family protein